MQKWWSLVFGGVLLAEFLLFAIAPAAGWWLPHLANRETFGWDIDKLFYLILVLTTFFFVLTEVILVVAMWRFAGEPGRRAVYVHGNHKLEMAWTLVPAAILLFIAFAQIGAWADIKYAKQMRPPHHVIEVSARQFEWRMRYPNEETRRTMTATLGTEEWSSKDAAKKAEDWGHDSTGYSTDFHTVNEVHTWAGANTRIYLKSRDVLHSFFLPNMRLKQDAVPGKVIPVWFRPDSDAFNGEWITGKGWQYAQEDGHDKVWDLACAELCGWGHYKMQGHLFVHKDKASYDRWLADAIKMQQSTTRDPQGK